MENEPQTQSTEDQLEQIRNVKLLIAALEMADNGYFRTSIPKKISSEQLLEIIRKHIPNCTIITHQVTTTPKPFSKYESSYDDVNLFQMWLFDISQKPTDSSEQPTKTIFVIDLSKMPSEEGIDTYFAGMNIKRNSIAGNPNGPVLVITPHLSQTMERFIHGCPDLQSCISGNYPI